MKMPHNLSDCGAKLQCKVRFSHLRYWFHQYFQCFFREKSRKILLVQLVYGFWHIYKNIQYITLDLLLSVIQIDSFVIIKPVHCCTQIPCLHLMPFDRTQISFTADNGRPSACQGPCCNKNVDDQAEIYISCSWRNRILA